MDLGLDDLITICQVHEMCNYFAMDACRSARLAWAIKCFEKGLLALEDTGGSRFASTTPTASSRMVEMIAYRQGIGDLLAEGSQRAAQRLGLGFEAFLTTVKGMEMAMHDPRHMPVMRASYLLAPTGGDHMRQTSNRNGLRNQIGLCHFLAYEDDQSLQIIKDRHRLGHHARGDGDDGASRPDARAALQPARGHDPRRRSPARPASATRCRSTRGSPARQQDKIVTDYYVEQGWDPATGVPTRGDHPRARASRPTPSTSAS